MNVTVNVRRGHFCNRRPKGYHLSQFHARSHVQEPLVPCKVKHSGNNGTVSWPLGPCCSAKGILGRSGKGSEATVRNEYGLEVGTSCLFQTLLFKVRASGWENKMWFYYSKLEEKPFCQLSCYSQADKLVKCWNVEGQNLCIDFRIRLWELNNPAF